MWQFENCLGAMDGKHILIKKPSKSGSYYFNYKGTFSVVLFAIVNANYEFLYVHTGTNGRVSDGGIWNNTGICKRLKANKLNIPNPTTLLNTSDQFPYVFIGDEAFPIMDNLMKPYQQKMPDTEESWNEVIEGFNDKCNFPHCIGSIDGKHIRIQKYPNTGSANYNYKGYHSIILLGCCDADGYFTAIECGFAGRNSDGGVFQASTFGQWLERDGLNIPALGTYLPNDEDTGNIFPYYFVGDNAFPLKKYLMRPYSVRNMDNVKRIFNYRLGRGRKTIECVFGMMSQKFQVLLKPITCRKYSTIISIVKCICILHNYIRKHEGVQYTANTFGESTIQRQKPILIPNMTFVNTPNGLRNYLSNYFFKPDCALPWQWNHCVIE
nr:unnamed protein product [Callosobruchus analis]